MKRTGYIYEELISLDNCRKAIRKASKGKRKRQEVKDILDHIDEYAEDLSRRLVDLNFVTPYRTKMIKDGLSKKVRELQIPSFYPDQCAHHAIIQVLKPIIERSSYHWSCANIPNRGIDKACKGVERATIRDPKHSKYCVKMDISKFYPSVNNKVLKRRLREVIKDERALRIIETVINTHTNGLPIGNYTSPWFAEMLLQPVDRLIKQVHKVKHFVRYADDMILSDSNKRKLRRTMYDVIQFVAEMLLCIKKDYQLFLIRKNDKKLKIGRKIDFVGKCFAKGYTTVRKRRALAFMRQSRFIQKLQKEHKNIRFKTAAGFISRCSCLRHTHSFGLRQKYYDTVDIKALKEVIRFESRRRAVHA